MSKQSEAKEKQGYTPKAVPRTCQNCSSFAFDMVQTKKATEWREAYFEDKNLRCEIGGFAVKKMGTCNEFKVKK